VYAWLWHRLPGPSPVRAALSFLLFLALVVVLFLWVFPWIEPKLPFTDVTVDDGGDASAARTLTV